MSYTNRCEETVIFAKDTADCLTVQSDYPSAANILPTTLTSLDESKLYFTDLNALLIKYLLSKYDLFSISIELNPIAHLNRYDLSPVHML